MERRKSKNGVGAHGTKGKGKGRDTVTSGNRSSSDEMTDGASPQIALDCGYVAMDGLQKEKGRKGRVGRCVCEERKGRRLMGDRKT